MNYIFHQEVSAIIPADLCRETVQNLWHRFCFTLSELQSTVSDTNDHTLRIGTTTLLPLPDGKEFIISVTESGVAITGKDANCLMRGYIALLMQIKYSSLEKGQETFCIPCGVTESNYCLQNRMIHLCVFPETDLYYMKKIIRLIGLCQYTHVVLEFWGSLKFDCMKELAWPNALSKAEAAELIHEIRAFGMEPIPMFNQLGHAAGARRRYMKHVVLDQNPALQDYFAPDEWSWNIPSAKVQRLFSKVRTELYDLFGPGNYIHLGFDEADYCTRCPEIRQYLPQYLHDLTHTIVQEGRKPMVWIDMLLDKEKFPDMTAHCPAEDVEMLHQALHPDTVMIDWQYRVKEAPVATTLSLKGSSFDVMGAPCLDGANIKAHVDTLAEHDFFGIMLTTWASLKDQLVQILNCAHLCGAKTFYWSSCSGLYEETAVMLRRISFEGNTYEESGCTRKQIE